MVSQAKLGSMGNITFIIEDAAIFQGEYVGFAVLQFAEVMADFQTLQVLCER